MPISIIAVRFQKVLDTAQCVRRILFLCVRVGEELLVGVVIGAVGVRVRVCLLYTSDAADE